MLPRFRRIPGGVLLWSAAMRIALTWRTIRGAVLLRAALCDWLPVAWQGAAAQARLEISEAWTRDRQRMQLLSGQA